MKQNKTIFLIDDDPDDHEIFGLALSEIDHPVHCIYENDGAKAVEALNDDKELKPDFIFIDMNMPRMNGQECLVEIKKIERLKDVPVFMYSTSADPESIQKNAKLGAADFIIKPSDINVLSAILSNIINANALQ